MLGIFSLDTVLGFFQAHIRFPTRLDHLFAPGSWCINFFIFEIVILFMRAAGDMKNMGGRHWIAGIDDGCGIDEDRDNRAMVTGFAKMASMTGGGDSVMAVMIRP
ncbi:hypothetical protein RIF29_19222 [Crotalaria pallida]|uniref:Uncharacterized protein n=1 Tax=Crotalaria pallida TaxID=3830 RepID=A0AAN9I3Y6_CROPI